MLLWRLLNTILNVMGTNMAVIFVLSVPQLSPQGGLFCASRIRWIPRKDAKFRVVLFYWHALLTAIGFKSGGSRKSTFHTNNNAIFQNTLIRFKKHWFAVKWNCKRFFLCNILLTWNLICYTPLGNAAPNFLQHLPGFSVYKSVVTNKRWLKYLSLM